MELVLARACKTLGINESAVLANEPKTIWRREMFSMILTTR